MFSCLNTWKSTNKVTVLDRTAKKCFNNFTFFGVCQIRLVTDVEIFHEKISLFCIKIFFPKIGAANKKNFLKNCFDFSELEIYKLFFISVSLREPNLGQYVTGSVR